MGFKAQLLPWHIAAPEQDELTIRRLNPLDFAAFMAHLHELDFDDFRNRFNGVVSDDWLARYVRRSLEQAVVLGIFDDGHLSAVAELHCENGMSEGTGESAFSVASSRRRCGIGTVLIAALLEAAWEDGVHSIIVETGPQNLPMQELARKFGARMHYADWMSVGRIDVACGLKTAEREVKSLQRFHFAPAEERHLRATI